MTDLSHRKSSRTVRILDQDGKALENCSIEIRQKKQKFLFGCGAFDVQGYIFNFFPEKREDLKKRTDLWLDVFNYATLPVYWGLFEPEEGKPGTEMLNKIADFFIEHDVTLKGHPLCWHTVCADWLMKYDNKTILEKQLARIRREVTGFRGKIDMWDVINEVVIMPKFDKYDNAITRICKEYGQENLVKMVFDEAGSCNPGATLLLNDFNTTPAYEDLIKRCLDAGAPINTIGIQSHQHQGYWGTEKIYNVLERFSKFGLPIHFTENTIISGSLVDPEIEDLNDWQVDEWPSTPEYEELQTKQLEEMYTILFSNPMVKAITQWDFSDGAWLKAPAGLIRLDGTPKPAYEMLKNKIKNEWFTASFKTLTDTYGCALVEGFKGSYDMIINDKIYSLDLGDDTSDVVIRI